MSESVGFIGFGEVASTFAKPIVESGAKVLAYDVLFVQETGLETLTKRAGGTKVQFCPLAEMIANVGYVLSTVTTEVAQVAAQGCVPFLNAGQVYLDLNSTAPSIKTKIAEIIAPSGAFFVEGAILGAVGATGAKTRILLGGNSGAECSDALAAMNLNVSFYSAEIGKASLFKMLRSIFSKGLEALLLEFLIAGKRAGIENDLWKEVVDLINNHPFEQVAANWIQSHAVAYQRRFHEMTQVTDTMREMGLEPILTSATESFFERSLSLGLDDVFVEKPDSMDMVVEFMENQLAR